MSYRIQKIQFYVRETKPARFASALGKAGRDTKKAVRATSPLCHVRMTISDSDGKTTFGCAADRLSVRWLDKRPGRTKAKKLRELTGLVEYAGDVYLEKPEFESAFDQWLACQSRIKRAGRECEQEALTSTYASALLERAMIDGVCRLEGKSFFEMLREEKLGIRPGALHGEIKGARVAESLPRRPVTRIFVRHTIGLFDPLTAEDWPAEQRLNDGLPETIDEYVRRQGIRYFKVKVSGDPAKDLKRLARIWDVVSEADEPVVTLDANEAFEDLEAFAGFVRRLEREQLGLFQHIAFIEQPLPRRLALQASAAKWIRQVGRSKPVIIDESDGALDAMRRALSLGYAGTSHKNCKGVFKSLVNRVLARHFASMNKHVLLSGEDLQNLPIVPLHQDFVSVGILGLEHCERNGHHYNYGLSMLSEKDKASVAAHHADLYEQRGDEWFLRIRDGAVQCGSLQCPGFGVRDEPDWDSMEDMQAWVRRRHPV